MQVFESKALVSEDGKLTAQAPGWIEPGEHKVTILVGEEPTLIGDEQELVYIEEESEALGFSVFHVNFWPPSLSMRREEMYDEWGR